MEYLWPILLMLAGCSLAALEVFVPSGGILAALSAAGVVASISLAFYQLGPGYGLAFTAVAVVALPTILAVGFRYLPNTPIGKQLILELPIEEDVLPVSRRDELRSLVGKSGIAKSPMLPSGAITIEGRTYDAVSQGMPIEAGQGVKVTEAKANRLVVRPLEPNEERPAAQASDLLDRPWEELGLENLDDLDQPLG